jgi:UDP-glucose 4-epimerase
MTCNGWCSPRRRFGQPLSERIDEEHPKAPINPHGASELIAERILADAAGA